MYPTVIRQEDDNPCNNAKNSPDKPIASTDAPVGTNTVEVGTKFDSGFSRYHMHTGCMRLTLRSGGTLSMRFNQFPGQGIGYAGVGPDSWSPAGRGGVFSFLPFIQQEYPLGVQTDHGTVDFNVSQGTVGTVTYYLPSTALAMRGRNDTATNLFTMDREATGERWIFSNKSSATVPGRLLSYRDRNGNVLNYAYRPRAGGGKYHILHSITGDLPQGMGVYFAYGDAANEAAWAHIRRFTVGNGTPGQDRAVYFEWDPAKDTLQRVAYPGGCTTAYDFNPAGGYVQAAIRKEVDQENYTTYFEYTNSSSTTLRKSVEPLGRATYFTYDYANATRIRAGRPATQFRSQIIGGGLQATRAVVRPDGSTVYYDYDAVTSRINRKSEPNGRVTHYTYNASYALVSEQEAATGAVTVYSYSGDGQSVRAVVGPRHTAGFPVLTYYEYDAKFNITREQSPVQAVIRRRFDAIGRLLAEVDPRGGTTYFRYDPVVGQVSAVVDRRGNSTYFRYNLFAETTSRVSPRWKEAGGMAAHTTSYGSDLRGRLFKQRDPLGNITYFSYTGRSDLAAVINPRGVVRTYRYDGLRRETRRTVATGSGSVLSVVYFEFDANDNEIKAIDGRGFATVRTYDVMDRLVTATDALAGVTYFGYDPVGNRVKARDPMGRTVTRSVDVSGRVTAVVDPSGRKSYFAYDKAGNLVKRRDARGNSLLRTYDAANRPVTEVNALGGAAYFGYDAGNNLAQQQDQIGRRARLIYDQVDHLITVIDPRGQSTYFGYDAAGNITKVRDPSNAIAIHAYDAANRRVASTDPLGAKTYFGYDAAGNQVKIRNALGHSRHIAYDAMDRMATMVDPAGGSTYFGYDGNGNIVKLRDQLGTTQTWSYDALSRRSRSVDAFGGVTYHGYDAVSNPTLVRDALGETTQSIYDALNRRIAIVDAVGGQTYFGYDAVGNLIKRRNEAGAAVVATYDALDRRTTLVDALAGKTYFGYDAVGRLVKIRDALGASITRAYDNLDRIAAHRDATGAKTYFAYDAADRLTGRTDALLRTTSAAFDAMGRPTAVTDPMLAIIRKSYDAIGNLRKEVDPLGRATYFAYDALARVAQRIDPSGIRTYFLYTPTSRLAGQFVKSAGATSVQLRYDAQGRKRWCQDQVGPGNYFAYDAVGNLVSASDRHGVTSLVYDPLNRLAQTISSRGDVTYFGYGPTSRRTKVQYPRGTARANLAYDALDRLRKLRSPTNRDVYYVYDAASRPSRMRFGNGAFCYFSFDAAHRPLSIRHMTASGASIAQFAYRRDIVGRTNRIVREGDLAIYFQYDAADRLTSEVWLKPTTGLQIYGFQYQYDAHGNRTSGTRSGRSGLIDSTTYVYDGAQALVKRWMTPTNQASYYTYDGSGAVRRIIESAGTTYFEYGIHGLVTRIAPPPAQGQPWSFGYDALLNRTRIKRGDNGKSTYFTWDGANQLEERDAVGTLIARFVHGTAIMPGVGSIVEIQRPSVQLGSQFLHMDQHGTVHRVTDAYGRIQIAYTTDAFGRHIVAPGGMTPTMANDIIYQGNWLTLTIGGRRLSLSPARVYDPELGRFLQRDPFPGALKLYQDSGRNALGIYAQTIFAPLFGAYAERDFGGTNLFAYASGSPVDRVDWAGMPDDGTSWFDSALIWLDQSGTLDFAEGTAEFFAGAGDAVTFGITTRISAGIADEVWGKENGGDVIRKAKKCSGLFTAGQVAGTVAVLATGIGAAGTAARAGVTVEATLAAGNAETIGLAIRIGQGSTNAVINHERFHVFVNALLGRFGQRIYNNSSAWRAAEELAAETFGTGSAAAAMKWFASVAGPEYGVFLPRVLAELGLAGAAGYGINSILPSSDIDCPCP